MCKLFVEKYKDLSDFQLIELIQQNDEQAFNILFARYLPLIKTIVSKHIENASDFEDMLQEATISFYYATIFYDFHSSSFKTYFSLCIERSIASSMRKGFAKKRIPCSMVTNIDDSEIVSRDENPENIFINKEETDTIFSQINNKLSKFENVVLSSYLKTGSYEKTAEELSVSKKSVDNALFRIRKKLDSINNG